MTEYGDWAPDDQITAKRGAPLAAGIWLDGLAAWLRDLGVQVCEHDGWKRRGRQGNSPYWQTPTHLMWHHTASSTAPHNDAAFIMWNADVAPLANLLIDRAGVAHVLAAGPTNTNGSGRDSWGGGVPDDSMNAWAVGIELANNGVGEPYPAAQLEALIEVSAAAVAFAGLPVDHVRAHHEWAPGRKIDPAGPSPWASGASSWDMRAARQTIAARAAELGDTGSMTNPVLLWRHTDYANVFAIGAGALWLSPLAADRFRAQGAEELVEDNDAMLDSVLAANGLTRADLTPM